MKESRTYTLDELIDVSGFDRRTISYYVQRGLLPKVGRRGPRTRYSQKFLDRLLYIKRLRFMQDTGRIRAVTLEEIRDAFATQTEIDISGFVAGATEPDWVAGVISESSDTQLAAATGDTVVMASPRPRAMSVAQGFEQPEGLHGQLAALARSLDRSRESGANAGYEPWVQLKISEDIFLAVRGLDSDDVELADDVVKSLKDLLEVAV